MCGVFLRMFLNVFKQHLKAVIHILDAFLFKPSNAHFAALNAHLNGFERPLPAFKEPVTARMHFKGSEQPQQPFN